MNRILLLFLVSALLFITGCATLGSDDVGHSEIVLPSQLKQVIDNSAIESIKLGSFEISSDIKSLKTEEVNTQWKDRLCEILTTDVRVGKRFLIPVKDTQRGVTLGVWLCINMRTRFCESGPVETYECCVIAAITDAFNKTDYVLAQESFVIERLQCSKSEKSSHMWISIREEILMHVSRLLVAKLREKFPIRSKVTGIIKEGNDIWIEIDNGVGDGIEEGDTAILIDIIEKKPFAVLSLCPKSGRSYGMLPIVYHGESKKAHQAYVIVIQRGMH